MSRECLERARDIFLACVRQDSPLERSAFMARECAGDTALLSDVAKLVEAHEANGSFLERPADGFLGEGYPGAPAGPLDVPSATVSLGSRIGPYQLLQQIGQGGFGVVYLAE